MLTQSGSCGFCETTRKSTPEALYLHDSYPPYTIGYFILL